MGSRVERFKSLLRVARVARKNKVLRALREIGVGGGPACDPRGGA